MSGAAAVTASAFAGALLAVVLALALSTLNRSGKSSTIVLAGIAVHSLAQTVLICLKLTADPERELASIEYWMMGSLNGVSVHSIGGNLILCVLCMGVLFLLHRQIILLSAEEGEARMLGVRVAQLRLLVLMVATLSVSSMVSLTGLISFVGLLAPHGARLLTGQKSNGHYVAGWAAGRDFALRSRYSGAVGGVDRASGQHLHQCSGSAVSDFSDCAGEAERVSFLSVEKISAGYGGHPILADVSLSVGTGLYDGDSGSERLRKNHPAQDNMRNLAA